MKLELHLVLICGSESISNLVNRTEWSPIRSLIVSITKCSLVIGSACAYLLRNCSVITWVSNYSCPIWTLCNWIAVIGQFRRAHVNHLHWIGFFWYLFLHYLQLGWNIFFDYKWKRCSRIVNILVFCYWYYNSGIIVLVISNRPPATSSADNEITHPISNGNWTEWSTVTVSNRVCNFKSAERNYATNRRAQNQSRATILS